MWRHILVALAVSASAAQPLSAQQLDSGELRKLFARPDFVPFPVENAYTAERAMLGRILFFDPRLSASNLLSCASCHNPSFGWGDGQALGRGHAMVQLARRSPSILNAAWGRSFFWDGRARTLEAQALGPIGSRGEMNMQLEVLPGKLAAIAGYHPLFEAAYPGEPISMDTIARAIGTFERDIVSSKSAFDIWVAGEDLAISASARRGLDLFVGPAGCAGCHTGWNLTDDRFHDTGMPAGDPGRALLEPDNPLAANAFKTPGLQDAVRRAPYMHDGSLATLDDVVRFYETGGELRPSRSPLIQPLQLDDPQRADLIAFLATLTAPPMEFAAPALPR